MRTRMVSALVVLIIISCLSAQVSVAATKLTIFSNFPKGTVEYDDFQTYLRLYESKHPNVVIEDLGRATSEDKLVTMYAAGTPPDLVGFTTHVMFSLYEKGFLADVPEPLAAVMKENLLPVTVLANTLRGKVMGLPFGNNVTTLYYNKRILSATGQNPKPPETWNELAAMSKKAKTPEHAGLVTSADAWSLTRFGTAMLWSLGGDVVDSKGKIVIDDTPFKQVLTYFSEWFRPDSHGVFGFSKVFNAGQAAFMLGIPGQLSALRAANPQYTEETGVARIPAGTAGSVANQYGHTYAVTKGPNEQAIWQLLEWFFFSGDGLVKGMTPMGDVCLRRGYPPFHKRDIATGLNKHADAAFYRGFIESVVVARNYEYWWEFGFASPLIGQGIKDAVAGKPASHIIPMIIQDIEKQISESH